MNNFDNNRYRAIVRALRQMVRCPHCSGTFSESDIEMVSNYGPFYAVKMSCGKCGLRVVASLTQIENNKKIGMSAQKSFSKQISNVFSKISEQEISADDMIGLHQFLDDFDGNFKSLFDV